jgi:lipid A disaccharide synthetase
MQDQMTGENLAREARKLLEDEAARQQMKAGLAEVARALRSDADPFEAAARIVNGILNDEKAIPAVIAT